MPNNLDDTLATLKAGGVCIYPTETFYALGCVASSLKAAARVTHLKGRPANKPLPLIIGSMDQIPLAAPAPPKGFLRLAKMFWPGPLSILVRTSKKIAPAFQDPRGFTALRWTAHPLAARLCRELNSPLAATSANTSGRPPAARPEELDQQLIQKTGCVIHEKPWPAGGKPSTLVALKSPTTLQIIRPGAVTPHQLKLAGYAIVD